MKISRFFCFSAFSLLFTLLVSINSFSQPGWKDIWKKAEGFYVHTAGRVEFTSVIKNVLKADTNYSEQTFDYVKSGRPLAKQTFDNGFTIYDGKVAYYIYADSKTYVTGNTQKHHLSFLPHWEPEKFFLVYKALGIIYKVRMEFDAVEGTYILHFTNKKDQTSSFHIDAQQFNIKKSVEIITHKKYGDQYTEYRFKDKKESITADSLLNVIEIVKKEFTKHTKESWELWEKERLKKAAGLVNALVDTSAVRNILAEAGIQLKTGQYILLDYFYQSCLPCIKGIPELNKFHKNFDPNALLVLGVDPVPDDAGHAAGFIAKHGILYPIIDGVLAKRLTQAIMHDYTVGYPSMVLVSGDGRILHLMEGYMKSHYTDMRKILEEKIR